MPDDSATIQGAVNALPDTVFVRSGDYSETPVLFAQVALLGIPGDPAYERPVLAGLMLLSAPQALPLFLVRGFQFAGRVYIQNDDFPSRVVFERCLFLAGISDISAFPATAQLTLRACQVEQDAFLQVDGDCVVDSCTFRESQLIVGQQNCILTVANSEFHGNGSGFAMSTIGQGSDIFAATITGNVVDDYDTGIQMSAVLSVHLEGNLVRGMRGGGIAARANVVHAIHNSVKRCIGHFGISAIGQDSLIVDGNAIEGCGWGMLAFVVLNGAVTGNVVSNSLQNGIHLGASPVVRMLEVRNNTSCLNAGSGFLSSCYVDGRYEFTENIGYGNGGFGMLWGIPEVTVVRCNDWFGNGLGAVSGLPPSSEDFSTDPLFCSRANGDFRLFAGSPLANWPGCGLVGALGVGCDVTATLVRRFVAERVPAGIQVVWELSEPSVAAAAWLERSEVGDQGPWTRFTTEVSHDGQAVVELDRSAVAERAYWYRLLTSLPSQTAVIGTPIFVAPRNSSSYRLALVGPSPARGPVRIEFELPERAAIELAIFDVQGRIVATPAQGVWPSGRHAVDWSGSSASARFGGVYLVRYRYPGGEDRRRVIRTP